MAKRTRVAVEKQLKRLVKHRAWLRQHVPKSDVLRRTEREILVLRTALVVERGGNEGPK